MITIQDFDRIMNVPQKILTNREGLQFNGMRNCFYVSLSPTRRIFRGQVNTNGYNLGSVNGWKFDVTVRDNHRNTSTGFAETYIDESVSFDTEVWNVPNPTGKPQAIPIENSFIFKVFDADKHVTLLTGASRVSNSTLGDSCVVCRNRAFGGIMSETPGVSQTQIEELIALDDEALPIPDSLISDEGDILLEIEPITEGEPITTEEPIIEIEPVVMAEPQQEPISLKQIAAIGAIVLLLI